MRIRQIPHGPIDANCYLIETPTGTALIDPCVALSDLSDLISPIKWIFITHCHYDHVSFLEEFRNTTNAMVYSHSLEFPAFSDSVKNGSVFFLLEETYPVPDCKITEGDEIWLDKDTKLEFIHTPGHTMGSICIMVSFENTEKALFTGDTLFQGSAGRTDLGGSPVLLRQSLQKLKMQRDSIIVYSGHGAPSTIGEEKQTNPFMKNI